MAPLDGPEARECHSVALNGGRKWRKTYQLIKCPRKENPPLYVHLHTIWEMVDQERITDQIYDNLKTIKEYFLAEGLPDVGISVIGIIKFQVLMVNLTLMFLMQQANYVKLMKSIFTLSP